MSRTNKKAYTKAKAVSKQCRCHGGCAYYEGNRSYQHRKQPNIKDFQDDK